MYLPLLPITATETVSEKSDAHSPKSRLYSTAIPLGALHLLPITEIAKKSSSANNVVEWMPVAYKDIQVYVCRPIIA